MSLQKVFDIISWNFYIIFIMLLYQYSCIPLWVHFFARALAIVEYYVLNRPIINNFWFTKYSFKDRQNIIMSWKANFYFTPYTFRDQKGIKTTHSNYTWPQSKYHPILSFCFYFRKEFLTEFFVIDIFCKTYMLYNFTNFINFFNWLSVNIH